MLNIEKVDGIRISEKARSIGFYESIGFKLLADAGFEAGHPLILQHASGVVINLLGPSTAEAGVNILMDVDVKHTGMTHVSYKVSDMDVAKAALAELGIPLTGEMSFKGMHAIFFRDPDRNVIELDAYAGREPGPRESYDAIRKG